MPDNSSPMPEDGARPRPAVLIAVLAFVLFCLFFVLAELFGGPVQ